MALTITGETDEFITLAEVKAHLNIAEAHTEDDGELAVISGAAQDHVESLIGPVRWREVVETRSHTSARRVVLRTYPVVSLGSVSYDGTDFTGAVVEQSGVVQDLYGYAASLTITYTAGRTECPDAIRLAALIIAGHLWRTQLGNSPSGALPQDGEAPQNFGFGYATPARAMDLLAPYMLPGGMA